MKKEFYDMKAKQKVELAVTGKKEFKHEGRKTTYALTAKTRDGRELMKFCSEAEYNNTKV